MMKRRTYHPSELPAHLKAAIQAGKMAPRHDHQNALHPGRTPVQRRILDAIGTGHHSPLMGKATREAMLKAGLIFELEPRQEQFLAGSSLTMTIRQFDMPIPVHMAWCDAMAAEFDEADQTNPAQ